MNVTYISVGNSKCMGCTCNNKAMKLTEVHEIGKMIGDLVSDRRGKHATIKIQIKFDC